MNPKPPSRSPIITTVCIAVILSISGCQTMNNAGDSYGRITIGCVGGALLGAGIGALVKGKKGAITGAAVGLGAGCIAGWAWEQHEQELRKLAQEENLRMNIEKVYAPATTNNANNKTQPLEFVTQLGDESMFDSGSDVPTADGMRKLKKLAVLFYRNKQNSNQLNTPILVVGHTDDTGSATFNQQLSENRAKRVVQILAEQGIPAEQLYYQGAGQGRPIADNTTESGRATNRRVEIVELPDNATLAKRIYAEAINPRYIQHTVRTSDVDVGKNAPAATHNKKKTKQTTTKTTHHSSQITTATNSGSKTRTSVPEVGESHSSSAKNTHSESSQQSGDFVDFGGQPVTSHWELASSFQPDFSGGFGLINNAVAASAPFESCTQDAPRIIGDVKNLAGKIPTEIHTADYVSGMNGKVWAAKVNGHVVYINPVSILRDNFQVAKQPQVAITKDYDKGVREITGHYPAVAATYKGQNNILMRIFIQDKTAPIQCLDVLLPYGGAKAQKGALYYENSNQNYISGYQPKNTSL